MTVRLNSKILLATLWTGMVFVLFGCATSGSERAEKTTTKMESVDGDLKQVVAQIDAVENSLQNLIRPGQSDTKEAFEEYSENVSEMKTLGEKLVKHTDEMSARGKDYFDEWKQQGNTYTNPQIRALSEQRMANLNTVFRRISDSSIGVKGAFSAYMNDIDEIQTFLSTDLTSKGIASITPVAEKAIRDGANLKSAISPVLSAIDNARTEMAQGSDN